VADVIVVGDGPRQMMAAELALHDVDVVALERDAEREGLPALAIIAAVEQDDPPVSGPGQRRPQHLPTAQPGAPRPDQPLGDHQHQH
jgi:hypothetical protein